MDKTKEYQKMLKAAPEIQSLWSPNIGDYHIWNDSISIISTENFKSHTGYEIRDRFSWGDENKYGEYIAGYFKDHVIMEFPVTEPFDSSIIKQYQEICTEYHNCFWFPRQDQLQDMLDYTPSLQNIDELRDAYQLYGGHAKTMEQLWLAFVMYEKFGKKWNGEEWV